MEQPINQGVAASDDGGAPMCHTQPVASCTHLGFCPLPCTLNDHACYHATSGADSCRGLLASPAATCHSLMNLRTPKAKMTRWVGGRAGMHWVSRPDGSDDNLQVAWLLCYAVTSVVHASRARHHRGRSKSLVTALCVLTTHPARPHLVVGLYACRRAVMRRVTGTRMKVMTAAAMMQR